MYSQMLITPQPGGAHATALWPERARSTLAAACAGSEVPAEFFGHAPAVYVEDCALPAPPPIILDATRDGSYRITALGRPGVDMMFSQAPLVYARLVEHLGVLCTFKTYRGPCMAEQSDDAVLYRSRRMVIARKRAQMDHLLDQGRVSLDVARDLIKRSIVDGIVSQATYLDDTSDTGILAALPPSDGIEVDVLAGDITLDPVTHPQRGGKPVMALVAKHLIFSLNINLTGPWYCGHVRSKGYGLITKERIHARA